MKIGNALVTGPAVVAVAFLALASLAADTIYLKNGQLVDGTYLGGTSQVVRFRVNGVITTYNVSDVQEIQFGAVVAGSGANAPAAATPPPVVSQSAPAVAAPAGTSTPPGSPTLSRPAPARAPSADASGNSRRAGVRSEYVIPSGTVLRLRTNELIDSESARVGDLFSATLDEDLKISGELVAERGSAAKLRLAQAEEAGEFKGRTVLTLDLIEMTVGNSTYELTAAPVEQAGEAQGRKTAAAVGGGAALAAIIGAIAGGGKGAAIGATVGAAGGAGVQVLTRGEWLRIPAETVLEFSLQRELFLRRESQVPKGEAAQRRARDVLDARI